MLGTPSPAVTPTNLLYNIIATPGALYRYWRQGQTGGRLALVLINDPAGVIAGSVIRVKLLPGPRVFDVVVAGGADPAGLLAGASRRGVGIVGGIYGISGGSILAPVLIGSGRKPSEVAPAALAATFVTSVAGVITFTILSLHQNISVAPDWPTGVGLGAGGLAGGYTGARIQSRMPDVLIRRLAGILVIAIGAYYLSSGLR